jgi:ribosomal protein L37AE/L43A
MLNLITCENGHPLIKSPPNPIKNRYVTCDVCGVLDLKRQGSWKCKTCNYDLCFICHETETVLKQ